MNHRVHELVQLLDLHRKVSFDWLAGDASLAASRRRLSTWVTEQMKERVRRSDAVRVLDDWSALSRAVRVRAITPQECEHRHAALIGEFLQS